MKPRLFWTILLAFTLVIILGVCGMLAFVGLAFSGFWQPAAMRGEAPSSEQAFAQSLADYYVAHNNSWDGVDQRLAAGLTPGRPAWSSFVLVDRDGLIVASNDEKFPAGAQLRAKVQARAVPIEARNARVGTLLLPPEEGPPWAGIGGERHGPPRFFWPILRGFLVAGLALAGGLLLLSVLFAQRLSRPIRRITVAAQELAAGKLAVQVESAPVRELDELAQTFNRMAAALAEGDRLRRQMTADIAHELRTPLTIMKGRLEGLQDGVYAATPEQIARLLEEAALLERLVEDLRVLALAEAGQLPLYRELLDPRELLEDTLAAFSAEATSREVVLSIEAAHQLPQIDADPQRMLQVLSNLVINALRYTGSGGRVTLEAQLMTAAAAGAIGDPAVRAFFNTCSAAIVLRVRDTGAGIAPDDLPHIFERFWRADRSRARESGGGGLGLAIVRQIVVAHGGAVWAASQPGHGTTISIALPAAEPET